MHIRPITAADIPDVHRMMIALSAHHQNFDAKVTPESVHRDALGPHPWIQILVAEDAGGLQGYAALLPLAKIQDGTRGIDINHMYVNEKYRGQGVGRALIDASAVAAKARGCTFMFIGTAPENTAAQQTYLACGFTRWADGGPRFRLALD